MHNTHPKLTEIVVEQTPKAMIALVLVSSAYFWIFVEFIPLSILLVWFSFQVMLAMYRFHNAKMLKKFLKQTNILETKKHEFFFLISNVFQAFMWTVASVLTVIYAPQPFELITLVLAIGIITAAALSMSSLYSAYLTFLFLMIIPQIIIMLYYGEHQHIGLALLALIFIPAIILLSRSIYTSRLATIKANEALTKNVKKLHKLSITDTLTNLYNRRYFFEVSENMISIALREKKIISLLMIDIDYFKKINDTYGHHIGDFVLIEYAKDIKKIMRESDIFARIGGEEFAVVLNDTSPDGARIIAEKIRKVTEIKRFIYDDISINITISIGISALNQNISSVEELYKEADRQLYRAKENGRNRVF